MQMKALHVAKARLKVRGTYKRVLENDDDQIKVKNEFRYTFEFFVILLLPYEQFFEVLDQRMRDNNYKDSWAHPDKLDPILAAVNAASRIREFFRSPPKVAELNPFIGEA